MEESAPETLGERATSFSFAFHMVRDLAAQLGNAAHPQLVPGAGAHGVPEGLVLAQVAHGAARQGAKRAGVEVGARLQDGELGAQPLQLRVRDAHAPCSAWPVDSGASPAFRRSSMSTARRRCGMTMRSADDEAHVEGLEELGVGDAFFLAADDVVGDAVVAAQHHGGHEAQELLGLYVERAGLVAARVEGEEALDLQVAGLEDARVHALAKGAEFCQAVGHRLRAPGREERAKCLPGSDSVKSHTEARRTRRRRWDNRGYQGHGYGIARALGTRRAAGPFTIRLRPSRR